MKIIDKEKIVKYKIFISDDNIEFDTENKCLHHERTIYLSKLLIDARTNDINTIEDFKYFFLSYCTFTRIKNTNYRTQPILDDHHFLSKKRNVEDMCNLIVHSIRNKYHEVFAYNYSIDNLTQEEYKFSSHLHGYTYDILLDLTDFPIQKFSSACDKFGLLIKYPLVKKIIINGPQKSFSHEVIDKIDYTIYEKHSNDIKYKVWLSEYQDLENKNLVIINEYDSYFNNIDQLLLTKKNASSFIMTFLIIRSINHLRNEFIATFEYFKEKNIEHCLDKYSIIELNKIERVPDECIPFLLEKEDVLNLYNKIYLINWESATDEQFLLGCELYKIQKKYHERYIELKNITVPYFIEYSQTHTHKVNYVIFKIIKDTNKKEIIDIFNNGFSCLVNGNPKYYQSDKPLFKHSQSKNKTIKKDQYVKIYT